MASKIIEKVVYDKVTRDFYIFGVLGVKHYPLKRKESIVVYEAEYEFYKRNLLERILKHFPDPKKCKTINDLREYNMVHNLLKYLENDWPAPNFVCETAYDILEKKEETISEI